MTFYLIEADLSGLLGIKAFIETDRNSRAEVEVDRKLNLVSLIRSGEIRPVKIIEVCEDEGWHRDVTDEIMAEVAEAEAEYAQSSKAARELFQLDHARDYRKNGE